MSSGQNEQQWLTALQQDSQRIFNQINSVVPQGYAMMSPEQITAAIRYADNGLNYLRDTYQAASNSLIESGSSGLYIQLQKVLHDLQDARNIYVSMVNPAQTPTTSPPGVPSSSSSIQNMLADTDHRNKVFRASLFNEC
jgi:hypothetical protein